MVEFGISFEQMSDESLLRYYENIRQQAEADRINKHHLRAIPTVRGRAEKLREATCSCPDRLDLATDVTDQPPKWLRWMRFLADGG